MRFDPSRSYATHQPDTYPACSVTDRIEGPYTSIGPVLPTAAAPEWEAGENGHASAVVCGDEPHLFYQARSQTHVDPDWHNR